MDIDKEMTHDIPFLTTLCHTAGVSGFEKEVCKCFIDKIKDGVDKYYTDVMGNAFGIIKGAEEGSKIMIEAHADEIGFQVIHIAENGYIYVRRNGGIDEQCLPGSQVVIITSNGKQIPGVIGKKPIHLMSNDDRKRTLELNQLWVDIGLEPEEVKAKVSVGDVVVSMPNMLWHGEYRISGKALDNRLGVYVVSQAMKNLATGRPIHNTIIGVTTVQEEVGSRGAVVASYSIHPDIAITVDLDFATDVPDCAPSRYGKITLGGGVIISLNADCDITLSKQLELIAKQQDIAYQISARPHATGGTNISRIQLARNGIRTISLGIPCRYMHTPVEMCDIRDVNAAIQLLTLFCTQHKI